MTPTQKSFAALSGHALGELKAAAGDIHITVESLLSAIRPSKQVSLDPTSAEMSDLKRIAASYLYGLGSIN